MSAERNRSRNDPEYDLVWSDEAKYRYDERIAIMTDGYKIPVNSAIEAIARKQARAFHAEEAAFKASQTRTVIGSTVL